MKFITFGILNKKFLLFAFVYILSMVVANISLMYIQNENILKNIPITFIIIHGSLMIFIFFECWLRKTKTSNEDKEKNIDDENLIDINKFYNKEKNANLKKFFVLILMIVLYYFYDFSMMFYQTINQQESELVFGEIYKFLDILFLLVIFLIFHKIEFYKHQYISLLIIILMGLGRFFIPLLYDNQYRINIKDNLEYLTYIFIIVIPFIDSVVIYFIQKYMIYHYYSPFLICFLIGFIFSIFSTIFVFAFNKNCGEYCKYLSYENIYSPGIGKIFLLILYSICHSSGHFMQMWTIYNFSPFHLILIVTFGEIINCIFKLISEYNNYNLILYVISYSFEILGVLVFIETIELNFCGLNKNLKKNIMFRAGNEIDSIYKIENEDDGEGIDDDIKEDENENDNTVYE